LIVLQIDDTLSPFFEHEEHCSHNHREGDDEVPFHALLEVDDGKYSKDDQCYDFLNDL
jgi:hypothetical protein